MIAVRNFILQLLRPINYPPARTYWRQPNIHCRDRAMLLFGFTCPAPLTVIDLVALDIDDVSKTAAGLEVRLFKKRKSELARYITLPSSDDPRLCAAQALLSWRRVLTRNGRTTGPLFIRLGSGGNLLNNNTRLTSNAATALVWRALREWRPEMWSLERFRLSNTMPLPHFLHDIMANAEVREAVFMLKPGPDGPFGPDPCERRYDRLL